MAKQQTKKSGGAKKYGRNLVKCKYYADHKIGERNKIKRVLQSNGLAAAKEYARKHKLPEPARSKKEA